MPPPEVRLRDQGRAGERSGRPPVPGVAFVVFLEPSVPAREKSLPGFAKVYKTMIFSKKGLGGSDGPLPLAGGVHVQTLGRLGSKRLQAAADEDARLLYN